MWRWCWCFALWQYFGPAKRKYLIFRRSHYIRGIHHAMVADDLGETIIEESTPLTQKQYGWRGLWHALTSRWEVRRGTDKEK